MVAQGIHGRAAVMDRVEVELETSLVDLTRLSLAELRSSDDLALVDSIRQLAERTVRHGSPVLQNQSSRPDGGGSPTIPRMS